MSDPDSGAFDIDAALRSAARFDARLGPLAKRVVDASDPAWVAKMRNSLPLDEAEIRQQAETLLDNLLTAYRTGDRPLREAIRTLFALNPNFAWATGPAQPADSLDGLRARLLRISARDRSQDLRDAILSINELCIGARAIGIDPTPVLAEIANISSDEFDSSNPSMAELFRRAR
jgi:hypothetical protein